MFTLYFERGTQTGAIKLEGNNFVEKRILNTWFTSVLSDEFWSSPRSCLQC
jgi:hypothetical protein